jgi:hypothetical protein
VQAALAGWDKHMLKHESLTWLREAAAAPAS